jgi:N-acetylglucosamine-6-phosphate deacetylase
MSDALVRDARILVGSVVLEHYDLIASGGRIAGVGPRGSIPAPAGAPVTDARGRLLVPGFIDLHTHGLHEHLADRSPEDVAAMAAILPRYGVTGFLPTLGPRPKGEDARFLATLARLRPRGARVLGFHLEGPFISLTGAFPAEVLGAADADRVRRLVDAASPHLAVFSVSPEFPGILDLLPLMRAGGAPVFMTHTRASVAQTVAAIEAGVRHATHFYDVFPVPPEVEPGVRACGAVEAVLADPRVSVDFILDGVHVDPVALRVALACKPAGFVCVITDANIGAGLAAGRYAGFGGTTVEVPGDGGPARLGPDSHLPGALAGSGLTMDRGFRNAIALGGVDLAGAAGLCSTSPARVLGMGGRLGTLSPGSEADMVLLEADLAVSRTWVGGELAYCREHGSH